MKNYILSFLLFLSFIHLFGAFFFSRSSSSKSQAQTIETKNEQVVVLRGVPDDMQEFYVSDTSFTCKDESKSISLSEINDGYCDCEDGSDEPGTSACSNGSFTCANSGYRSFEIPSSRVDDGLCDCCDGSDEGEIVKCPNNCRAVMEAEKAMITELLHDYSIGSKVRAANEMVLGEDLRYKASMLSKLVNDLETVSVDIDKLREKRYSEKEKLDLKFMETKSAALIQSENIIHLNEIIETHQFPVFLLSLFNVINISEADIQSIFLGMADDNNSNEDVSSATEPLHDESEIDENEDHSPHEENEDHYESEHGDDAQISLDTEVSGDVNTVDDVETSVTKCEWGNNNMENHLLNHICQVGGGSFEFAKKFLMEGVLKSRKPFNELQILVGYFITYKTFDASDKYYEALMAREDTNVCPLEFSVQSDSICNLGSQLEDIYRVFELSFDNFDPIAIQAFKEVETAFYGMQKRLDVVESDRKIAESAANDLEVHGSYLSLLAHRNDCFETIGGAYKYSFCPFGSVTQSEVDGHSTVTLGSFDSVVGNDDGSFFMKFKEGQHCYAFGARSADVKITCGKENALISAREPSTCFYHFDFISPVGCTEKFAANQGLLNFLT